MFYKIIYLIGEYIKNPLIRKKFYELKESDFASLQTLEDIQLDRLKQLLAHAKEYSVFYKERLNHIDIDNMRLSDLQNIPLLSKKELLNHIQDISNNPHNEKLIKSETSGSTGEALIFYRNLKWDAYHRAAQYRGYSWYDINPWDKNIYFWGFNPNWKQKIKIRILDLLMNRYRIFSFDEKVLHNSVSIIKKSKYIEGYSSAIYTLSQYLYKNKYKFENIKLVKGTSEKIYDNYHKIVKDVFGLKMTSEYGAAEAGIIAFECPEGNMHIAMENVIVEVVDEKIVITNLHSYSFPIIRYELGDYVKLSNKKCNCGREHLIIEEVTGRIGQKIVGYHKEYPSLSLYYIFKNIALQYNLQLAYFASQYKIGELKIDVIVQDYDKNIIKQYIYEEANKYFKDDIVLSIRFTDKIEHKNKKTKDFESYLG